MSDSDILDKIDDTLTFYSAGLGENITVPSEREPPKQPDISDEQLATWLNTHIAEVLRTRPQMLRRLIPADGPRALRIRRRHRRRYLRRVPQDYRRHGRYVNRRWFTTAIKVTFLSPAIVRSSDT